MGQIIGYLTGARGGCLPIWYRFDICNFAKVHVLSIYHQRLIFGFYHMISPPAGTLDND